jgi:aspartate-semialdehyde dehydrogenase
MKVAVVGATGLVGTKILQVLEERNFPVDELLAVASSKSLGQLVKFKGRDTPVIGMEEAIALKPNIALFSAGGTCSAEWAEKFAEVGTTVIDNSSQWRMDPSKKLIVPEVNGSVLSREDKIIANPNCSTIQMLMVLKPLHDNYKIKRVVVSTYQSVTGTGKKAVDQMMNERNGVQGEMAYPYKIDMNLLPHIDVFNENGYTKEELKMVNETKKILGDDSVLLTATAVRVPVMGGHSESVNIEFVNPYDLNELIELLKQAPGLVVQNNVAELEYPMPLFAHEKDEVFVGRIRRDDTQANTLNCWIVSDNLRKGAATNAVQIAEYLVKHNLLD